MATDTNQNGPSLNDLIVKALEQVCYNTTGLDVTIGAIKEKIKADNQPAPVQPVVSDTDNPQP